MALDATALVELPEAKAFLVATGSADDPAIEAAINVASLACEAYCNRLFRERVVTERVEGPWTPYLPLRAVPLKATDAVTVSVDEVAQTVWRSEADGVPGDFDVIARADHLWRRSGNWGPGSTPYNVLVSYTGGYATGALPASVTQACLYFVQKLFRDQKRQLAEVASVNTPMGGITLLDNAMPRMARMLLDEYRFLSVA